MNDNPLTRALAQTSDADIMREATEAYLSDNKFKLGTLMKEMEARIKRAADEKKPNFRLTGFFTGLKVANVVAATGTYGMAVGALKK